jgi:hypothetical protein
MMENGIALVARAGAQALRNCKRENEALRADLEAVAVAVQEFLNIQFKMNENFPTRRGYRKDIDELLDALARPGVRSLIIAGAGCGEVDPRAEAHGDGASNEPDEPALDAPPEGEG